MMITYDDNHQISCFLCIIYIYTMAENMYYKQYYSGEPCDSGFEIAVPRCSWPGGVVIPHERDPGATYRCSFLAKKFTSPDRDTHSERPNGPWPFFWILSGNKPYRVLQYTPGRVYESLIICQSKGRIVEACHYELPLVGLCDS